MIFNPVPGTIPQSFHVSQWHGQNPGYYKKYGLKGHNGIDFAIPVGTPLYAPFEGYVHFGNDGAKVGYGTYCEIWSEPFKKDGTKRFCVLAHLSKTKKELEGKYVSAGTLVCYSGNTGDSTGPHLHLTYKNKDSKGNTLEYNNGYKGSIDVSSYIELWLLNNVLRPVIS